MTITASAALTSGGVVVSGTKMLGCTADVVATISKSDTVVSTATAAAVPDGDYSVTLPTPPADVTPYSVHVSADATQTKTAQAVVLSTDTQRVILETTDTVAMHAEADTTVSNNPPLTVTLTQNNYNGQTGIRASGTRSLGATAGNIIIALYDAAAGQTRVGHGVTTVSNAFDGAWQSGIFGIGVASGKAWTVEAYTTIGSTVYSAVGTITLAAVDADSGGTTTPPSGGTTTPPPPPPPVVAAIAPPPPAPAGILAQFDVRNETTTDFPARIITTGRPFAAGALTAGLAGAQVDVTAPNNRAAAITLAVPAIPAGGSYRASLAAGSAIAGTPVAVSAVPLTVDITVTALGVDPNNVNGVLALATPQTYHLDFSAPIAASTDYWMRGPLVTEVRADMPVVSSLHVIMDVAFYADGNVRCQPWFANDLTMGTSGGPILYSATVSYGGVVKATLTNVTHWQYQELLIAPVWSGDAPQHHVAHPPSDLIATGTFSEFDTAQVYDLSKLPTPTGAVFAPLGGGNYAKYQGQTGGRPDIGPSPLWITPWLVTQSKQAADYAKAQSDAYGANPIYFRDVNTGDWMKVTDWPNLWADGRQSAAQGGLTQGMPVQLQDGGKTIRSGWQPDGAHQPRPHLAPALLTGERYRYDLVVGNAAFSVFAFNPGYRQQAKAIISANTQVRGRAWDIRMFLDAAFASKSQGAAYATIVDNNLENLLTEAAGVATVQGEMGFMVGGAYGAVAGIMAPWQQDFVGHVMVLGLDLGFEKCGLVLDKMMPFLATACIPGRFAGWNPASRAAYNLQPSPAGGPYTFAATQVAPSSGSAKDSGTQTPHGYQLANGNPWPNGDVAQYIVAIRALFRVMARRNRHPDWAAARDWMEPNFPTQNQNSVFAQANGQFMFAL